MNNIDNPGTNGANFGSQAVAIGTSEDPEQKSMSDWPQFTQNSDNDDKTLRFSKDIPVSIPGFQSTLQLKRKASKKCRYTPHFHHINEIDLEMQNSHRRMLAQDVEEDSDDSYNKYSKEAHLQEGEKDIYEDSREIESTVQQQHNNFVNLKPPGNADYVELVKTIKRARLDSLMGVNHNFLENDASASQVLNKQLTATGGIYKIFDLGNKQYKDCTFSDILNFKRLLISTMRRATLITDFSNNERPNCYMILISQINESNLRQILQIYDLNPLLLWEIILKQQYDKVVKIDDQTAFYNFEVLEDNSLLRKFIVKVIHLLTKNMMFVFTTQRGQPGLMTLLRKIFKFKELSDQIENLRENDEENQTTQAAEKHALNNDKLSIIPKNSDDSLQVSENGNSSFYKSENSSLSQIVGKQQKRGLKYNKQQTEFSVGLATSGSLNCEDLIYGIIDESLRKIEPIIVSFDREAQALNNLSLNLSYQEKLGYVRRSHLAKDIMVHFQNDLEVKQQLFKKLQRQTFASPKLKLLIKFLKGRLCNSLIIMKKATTQIQLSDQTYENMVDSGIQEQSNNLNTIMQSLAAITVVILPFNVISGFMGMNVLVPFAEVESVLPFFMLFATSSVLAILLYYILKHMKWM
ncbi:-like mg2+ transporter [Stylonychia lemnae]|uniref:-like mg2+ transporter n=1 Tax=Stylonychia lemnae TaxID=5949 RepID=A0A078A8I6_STYLE|nr:-like mg2+ transporter [Stylonychia lemnae]|eukprot:CDW78186.1 -like mg2+ transporter [Stylonychia lemnae]